MSFDSVQLSLSAVPTDQLGMVAFVITLLVVCGVILLIDLDATTGSRAAGLGFLALSLIVGLVFTFTDPPKQPDQPEAPTGIHIVVPDVIDINIEKEAP